MGIKFTTWHLISRGVRTTVGSLDRVLIFYSSRPAAFFLTLVIPMGIVSVFVMPPFMVPDENAHLYRAYEISEGQFLSTNYKGNTGAILPLELRTDVNKMYIHSYNTNKHDGFDYGKYFFNTINTKKQGFIEFNPSSVYSPVAYIPQAIGVGFARIFFPSELLILYLGRLFNLAAFIVMVFFAIKIALVRKWLFVAAALLPMTLQQAASLSSDVMTIGISFLAIAYSIRLFTIKNISRGNIIWAVVLSICLGLTKQTNVLLIIPFLFIPTSNFGSLWRRFRFIIIILLAGVGSVALWYFTIKLLHYNMDYSGDASVNMYGQIHFLLQHPLSYVKVLFRSFVYNSSPFPPSPDFYWNSVVGVFSWIKYQLPLTNVLLAYLSLAIALLITTDPTKVRLFSAKSGWFRFSLIATLFISILGISTLLYLVWTPVAHPVIAGIQGRYFIPLLPLLAALFLVGYPNLQIKHRESIPIFFAVIAVVNFTTYILQTIHFFS